MLNVVVTVISIVIYVLSVAGMWMMFRKAGRRGWISIIPVANTAILFLIGWKKIGPFILQIVIGFVGVVLMAIAYVLGAIQLFGGDGSVAGMLVLFIIAIVLIIIGIIIGIMMTHKVSQAYGHKIGYTVGLIFVPFIMYPIIGFGDSEYVGEKVTHKTKQS